MSITIVATQMAKIALLVILGGFLARKGYFSEESQTTISKLIVNVCNPALTIYCVAGGQIDAPRADIIKAGIVSIIIFIVLIGLGFVLPKILLIEKNKQKYYNMMSVYPNAAYMGIPVARALLNDSGMLCVIIFNVFFSLIFYTHGYAVMGIRSEKGRSGMISIGTVSGIAAILIAWFRIPVPTMISDTLGLVGNCTTFLAMSMLGAILITSTLKELLGDKKMYLYGVIRLLVIPILAGKILTVCGADRNLVQALCLMLAMPSATIPLMLAKANGEDTSILSRGIMFSTLMSFFCITIVMTIV